MSERGNFHEKTTKFFMGWIEPGPQWRDFAWLRMDEQDNMLGWYKWNGFEWTPFAPEDFEP